MTILREKSRRKKVSLKFCLLVCLLICLLVYWLAPPEKKFMTREDFSTLDDYARYIRDHITVGIMVRCCEAYEEVKLGDVGRVMKVTKWEGRGGGAMLII